MINPFQILGVHQKSTNEEIRAAYIKIATKTHPDKKKGKEKLFEEATLAYTVLKTKQARQQWNDLAPIYGNMCQACRGAGVTSKSKGFTEREYSACSVCFGAGYIVKGDNHVTIKLR